MIEISVAICTHNRPRHLRAAIRALQDQTLDKHRYEIIIIDNSDVFNESFASTLEHEVDNLSVFPSAPPGLSRARNEAVRRAGGPIIAFIDDDAIPGPEWLEAILLAFNAPKVSVVGGPVHPIWPQRRPDWIPKKYEGAFTILNLGETSKELPPGHYVFGTNMAFRVNSLTQIGGFRENLGRTGGAALLSEEDTDVQDRVRAIGGTIWYAATAGVQHTVHSDRISREWLRSRMAWQAVSEIMREPRRLETWQVRDFESASAKLGVLGAVRRIFASKDSAYTETQLSVLYGLTKLALGGQFVPSETWNGLSGQSARSYADHFTVRRPDYLPAAAKHVFFETAPGHAYLYDVYGRIPGSYLLSSDKDAWSHGGTSLDTIDYSSRWRSVNLIFLTLDPFIYSHPGKFRQFLDLTTHNCFGFLHRPPVNAAQLAALEAIWRRLRSLFIFSDTLLSDLPDDLVRSGRLKVLPHPAGIEPYMNLNPKDVRGDLLIGADKVVFSILGEARSGKGIDLLLAALRHVPGSLRSRIFLLLAGRTKDLAKEALEQQLRDLGYPFLVDLRTRDDSYMVLTELELARYVFASDIGLLLYNGGQERLSSGILPKFIAAGKTVIANQGTAVGEDVSRHELGVVVDALDPEVLAQALINGLEARPLRSERYANYQRAVQAEASCSALLSAILGRRTQPFAASHDFVADI